MHQIKIRLQSSLFIFCAGMPQHCRGLENGIFSVSTDQFHTLKIETFVKNKIIGSYLSPCLRVAIKVSYLYLLIGNDNIKTVFLF